MNFTTSTHCVSVVSENKFQIIALTVHADLSIRLCQTNDKTQFIIRLKSSSPKSHLKDTQY